MIMLTLIPTQKSFLIYIKCTLKNTHITLTHPQTGKILLQTSSRSYPLKIKKKNNVYILQKISQQVIDQLKLLQCKNIKIIIKGIGRGRYNIVKHLFQKFNIVSIKDQTPVPFNGCRPPKIKRR